MTTSHERAAPATFLSARLDRVVRLDQVADLNLQELRWLALECSDIASSITRQLEAAEASPGEGDATAFFRDLDAEAMVVWDIRARKKREVALVFLEATNAALEERAERQERHRQHQASSQRLAYLRNRCLHQLLLDQLGEDRTSELYRRATAAAERLADREQEAA
jgi:hypothetical protein